MFGKKGYKAGSRTKNTVAALAFFGFILLALPSGLLASDFLSTVDRSSSSADRLWTELDHDLMLAQVSRDIHQPAPIAPAGDHSNANVLLPVVPPALMLGIVGFACLTLVRDRKFWLLLAAGALSLSVAGLHSCTKLAYNITAAAHKRAPDPQAQTRTLRYVDPHRTRSEIEGTSYIALLRYLASLPAGVSDSLQSPSHTRLVDRISLPAFYADSPTFCDRLNNTLRKTSLPDRPAFDPGRSFELLAHGPPA